MISLDFPGASFIAFVLKNTTNSALVHFLLLKYDPKFISQHMTFMPCRTLPILLFVNKIEDLLVLFIRDGDFFILLTPALFLNLIVEIQWLLGIGAVILFIANVSGLG